MSRTSIFRAYALPVFYTAVVGLYVWFLGDAPADILRKMLIAPMAILASCGLRTFFPEANDDTRGPWTQLEYQVLNNLLLAASTMLVVTPFADGDVLTMIWFVVTMATMMTALNMAFFLYARRKQSGPH